MGVHVLKHKVKLIITGALLIGFAVILLSVSLTSPIAPRTQLDCLSVTRQLHQRVSECPASETLWHRSLSDPVAYYSLWLMLFTAVLGLVAAVQSTLTYDQIKLSRDEFVATHRPRLHVRNVKRLWSNHGPWSIRVEIVNTGDSDAEAYIQYARVVRFADLQSIRIDPMSHPFEGSHMVPLRYRKIPPGWNHRIDQIADFILDDSVSPDGRFVEDSTIVVVGSIQYADARKVVRTTGFIWEWDFRMDRFDPLDDREFSYED